MTRARHHSDERGSIPLTMAVSIALTVGGFIATVMTVTSSEVFKARQDSYRIRSEMIADLALEEGVAWVYQVQRLASLNSPFAAFDTLSESDWTQVHDDVVAQSNGNDIGTYSVWVRLREGTKSDPFIRDIEIRAVGRYDVGAGTLAYDSGGVERRLVARSELKAAEVFDYSYFLNNWGWFYGSSITANGNVRSNGQFDAGGYSPYLNGTPRYLGMDKDAGGDYSLSNQIDDGGVYSGWDLKGIQNVRGMGATTDNQYAFQAILDMPNLNELGIYEDIAIDQGSTVQVSAGLGAPRTISGVYGDDAGESGHLYLYGTESDPIELNGPIVARGHVFIKGYVTGQGAIYSGGNIYVGDDIVYDDPPSSPRPSSTDQSDVEDWLSKNADKDTLGLYAKEHIIIGDATSWSFRAYVGGWLSNSKNESSEDSGEDKIPNTSLGRDGLPGTEDDDVLEGNGTWDVERYTAAHAAAGQVPSGRNVGDPIPGSGEDIDGDGRYDGRTTLADLSMPNSAWSDSWGGNKPAGRSYADLSTNYIARLDAAFYTNHTLGARVINSGGTIQWNGSMVARNEAIVYSASKLEMNHDARLYGGGELFHYHLPKKFTTIHTWPMFGTED